jgi:hypothetical protein
MPLHKPCGPDRGCVRHCVSKSTCPAEAVFLIRRLIAIFVLVQQAAWLLVILPGHQRGAMAIAGTGSADASCHVEQVAQSCCESTKPAKDNASDKSEDPLKKLNHCAVCHVAVRLTPAPPPDLVPSPTGLVERLSPSGPGAIVSLHIPVPYDSTGPPASC